MSDLLGIHVAGGGGTGAQPDEQSNRFIDHWAPAIFDAWRPHRNPQDGGVVVLHLLSETNCRAVWIPYAKFVKTMGAKLKEPYNWPAHEVNASVSGVPGDVTWVLAEDPVVRRTHIYALQWPTELEIVVP